MGDNFYLVIVAALLASLNALALAFLANINKKVSDMCASNDKEHDELYSARNCIERRIQAIETTHHQRGCDQPFRRRGEDE